VIIMTFRCTSIFFVVVGLGMACGDGKSGEVDSTSPTSTTNMMVDDDDDGRTSDATAVTSGVDPDGSDTTGGGGLSQTKACAAYLECAAATTPAELPALLEAYGPDGTCWQSTPELAEQCDTACMTGLVQLQEMFQDEPACGGGGGSTESSTGAPAGPPMIVSVSWMNDPNCTPGVASDVVFTIDVGDPDDELAALTFSGLAIGCTGQFDSPMTTILCPNVAPYSAMIEVSDPDGNSDSIDFMFSPCEDGTAP
jgi:hypothetical protein